MKKLLYVILVILLSCSEGTNEDLAPKLGDTYQGGIVFYILQPGDPSFIEGEIHGFIVNEHPGGEYFWGCYEPDILQNLGKELGDGENNTVLIASTCSTERAISQCSVFGKCYDVNAASVCLKYGWYLPNGAETNKLFHNKLLANITSADYYWTSDFLNGKAIAIRFSDGNTILESIQVANGSPKTHKIKPIKRF